MSHKKGQGSSRNGRDSNGQRRGMKRFGFLIAILVTAASAVTAQDVVVRSGEHDGFTRLVFDVPPDHDSISRVNAVVQHERKACGQGVGMRPPEDVREAYLRSLDMIVDATLQLAGPRLR